MDRKRFEARVAAATRGREQNGERGRLPTLNTATKRKWKAIEVSAVRSLDLSKNGKNTCFFHTSFIIEGVRLIEFNETNGK